MTLGSRAVLCAVGAAFVCALGTSLATGQTSAPPPPMAEDVFTNLQVLRGIPVNLFMETMGFFSASVGGDCGYCHVSEAGGSWAKYADDSPRKQTARRMVRMVAAINKDNFGGRQVVTCYTCHRGVNRPRVTPSLAALYGAASEDPNDVIAVASGGPSADQVLDKYIQAVGGAARLANLTSFAAKGTYQGYDDLEKHPMEVFAKAPSQRTVIVHTPDGDNTTTYDGRNGWTAAPYSVRPVPVLALSGGDLDGVRLDAELSFPAWVKQALGSWRIGRPDTIDDRQVQVLQGTGAGGALATLFFDAESGLLVRVLRYSQSPVGRIPTQIDFADYRDVSGVKMPYRWQVTWLDGRSTIEFSEIQTNGPVDAAKFGKPATPTPPRRP